MILIIAEKPSVMKNIIDARLEDYTPVRYKGYAMGKNVIYTHCIGHLLTLKMPNEIDDKYTFWALKDLPFNFKDIPLKINDPVNEQYQIVNNLLHNDKVSEVINACDSDREGDLIFRNLYKYSHPHVGKITRMWIESQTPEGIKESFSTRLNETEYNNVYFAGKARSYADYIIGLNSTRAMTCKFGGKDNVLTVGRVQTPTLRILVDTEKEINDFHPQKFYKIQATGLINGSEIVGNYINEELDQNRFMKKEDCEEVIKNIGIGDALILEASTTLRKEKPKMLYSLSDLQVDMDKRYHMSPLDVLNTVQSLYETHKLVTYPRTDENHISKELANKVISIVKSLAVHDDIKNEIIEKNYKINPIMIAKKDIGAHEALTPTGLKVNKDYLKKLSISEIHVYMAIVERFLASFLPDAEISKQKVVFKRNEAIFETTFEACTSLGHRKAYTYGKKENEKDKPFIKAFKGEMINITKLDCVEGETKPPSRFSEGSLIKMMKNPTKYVADKADKAVLKEVEGIGTEATRASIIDELRKRKLIEDFDKKYIKPTTKGINLIETIPSEDIKSVKLTAYFEKRLSEISKGEFSCDDFLDEINKLIFDFVSQIKGIDKTKLDIERTKLCDCPICQNPIIEKQNLYGCINKDCDVAIFKNSLNAKLITRTQAKNLLLHGNSETKVLCKSKNGNDFEALMTYRYDKNAKYHNVLGFDFNSNALSCEETQDLKEKVKPICKCPRCKSNIIETPYSYRCENKECNVAILKSSRGVTKWTKKAISELFKEGITSSRLHVKTKSGQEMDVYLKYSYDETKEYPNQLDYVFDKVENDDENK